MSATARPVVSAWAAAGPNAVKAAPNAMAIMYGRFDPWGGVVRLGMEACLPTTRTWVRNHSPEQDARASENRTQARKGAKNSCSRAGSILIVAPEVKRT